MRQLGTEEKAALLLTPIDDDDDEEIDQSTKTHRDQFTTVTKRPRTSYRTRTNSSHPVLVFILILSAFIFGCLSGVVIMIYRISQDAERPSTTNIDLSIQTKLSQTITKTNFLHLNFSTESLNDSAKKLEQTWQTYPKVFKQIKQISYDLTLTKYAPSNQWSGIQLIDENKNKELTNFNLLLTNEYLTYSSLIKSGQFDGKFICYVNYGRDEDLAYLFQQNIIQYENHRQTIVFMRRKSTIISQTEQIRQGIRYEFGGIVLFDDDNDQQNEQFQINNRQSIIDQWKHLSKNPKFLEDFSIDHEQQILLLTLSNSDVENIFSAIPSDSNQWPIIPEQWYSKSKVLKLGGHIQDYKLRMSSFIQEIPVQLPVLIGQIRGDIEPEKFIILGYQLGEKQQETIVNEIIRAFNAQMTNGWKPRRSILICAWSDLTSDHFTVERWINENKDFIEQNLIGYFDLADGIQANTTLNLHGSPLFEQIATRTADFVVSPLVHDHVCHHRQTHIHRKRRHDDHNQPSQMNSDGDECQPHKLLDEWIRTTKTRFQSNQTFPIVQLIDSHSRASIFQLKYGIPSLTIEMTDLQFIDNQTFYSKKLRSTYSNEIQPEIFVSYTQFLAELIRQFIDQPLIPFNLTNYADLIDTQTSEYFAHFDRSYRWLISTLGDSNEMSQLINDLTKSIRQNQRTIDQTSKDLIQIQQSNQKLAQFEHLFLSEKSKHLFIGPAYGLTNTVVSYPTLSNLLYNMTSNPPQEFLDAIKYHWLNLRKQIQLIRKTLNGFDGLLTK